MVFNRALFTVYNQIAAIPSNPESLHHAKLEMFKVMEVRKVDDILVSDDGDY